MSKQIMDGMLTGIQAKIEAALAKGRMSYLELYVLVCSITNDEGLGASHYVYEDIIDELHNALLECIGDGDPANNTDWEYLQDVDWLYPDTDDDDLYERLYTENVDELFDCLQCVECIIHVSKTAAEFLVKYTNEAVFYNKRQGEYAWVIPFFNMPWSVVSVDVMPK